MKQPLTFPSFHAPIRARQQYRDGELEGVELAPKGGYYVRLYMGTRPTIFGWTFNLEDACRLADIVTFFIRPRNYRYNYSLEQVKKDLKEADVQTFMKALKRLDWDKI